MGTRRRQSDWIGCGIAGSTVIILIVGWVISLHAQPMLQLPQVAFNAVVVEQITSFGKRMDRVEGMVQYALIGIIGNLLTLVFMLFQQSRKRTH